MSYWLIFLTGLTSGGVSCAAMQGGLLAGLIANQKSEELEEGVPATKRAIFDQLDWLPVVLFLATKLISHTILGFFLGWVGSQLELSLTMRLVFQAAAALFVLATAANLLELHPIFRFVVIQPPRWAGKLLKNSTKSRAIFAPAMLGFLTILVPCGVTQSMELLAISSGNPVVGALTMFFFVLGTSPIFAVIGIMTARLSEKFRATFLKLAAALLIILGISSLNGVLTVLDAPITLQKITYPVTYFFSDERFSQSGSVATEEGIQKVTINVTNDGYTPRYIKVKAGVPVELTLSSQDAYTCAVAFTFKQFNIATFLQPTDTQVFTFTPTQKGRFTYACSMGMYVGTMEVI